MGTCTYTLSKFCGDDGELPFFNVEAANENRGTNTRVSYIKYVNVDVYGYRITLDKGNQVKVDGKIVTLPTTLTPEVKIFLSGVNVMVTTSFGLQVKYDGKSKVVVTIPDDYADKLCGICGNFNGNKTDDFLNPDGELEPDSSSLGNSWQVENDTSCTPGTDHTPECTEDEKNTIASNSFCGLITDINGPFRACHAVINPSDFFDTCVFDLCELNLDLGILCSSLQTYADACQSQGVTIEPWRNATFCPLKCPPNSHYEPCGTSCPATCVNPDAPSSCSLPCAEGCVCDPGYVLYDKKCVPSLQCGCWDGDKYYPVGSEFWTDNTCSSKCKCPSAGSNLVCNSESCPSNQYCKVTNGQASCQYYVYGICRIHNDPHYDTFDRQNHDFMGLCTYTLAKLCDNSSSLPYFNIEAKNEHRGDPSVTYVQQVLVEVFGYRVHILKNEPARVLVNNVWTTLPVMLDGGAVKVSASGRFVVLETNFKLKVSYDTDHSVEVKLPDTYFNATCGMCGNFNNRKQDDYIMPNGQLAQNSEELGDSWIVYDQTDPQCSVQPTPPPPGICTSEDEELFGSVEFCGILTSLNGLFSICHAVVDPEGFFESCLFDLCALGENSTILCGALEAYADACQREGITIPNWREMTSCGDDCLGNSHYNACMSACPATCIDPQAPDRCPEVCMEGCECDEGYILSGGVCVSESDCGCWLNDQYYNKGETFLEKNCKSSCECLGNNNLVCSSVSCTADEICEVQNGLLGCYPASTAICHIYGDPHYSTFDGTLHHFQGSCNYTVSETCKETSNYFIVTTRNEHRGSPHWTAINSVALTVDGTHILLQKNNIVLVNNVSVVLPTKVNEIDIKQSGHYVIVTTNFGLELQFNGDHELFVRVKEYYKDTLCGLCGTYNDNKNDDFMTPDGNVVSDVNDFGNSWRVEDDEWICESTPPPPVTCPPLLQEEAEAQCTIIKLENGPFAPCHSFIPPEQYFESCVYDHCASDGNHDLFCDSLESYAASCEGIGVSLGDWRKDTICEIITTSSIPPTTSHTITQDFTSPFPGTDESSTTSKHVSLPGSDSTTTLFPGTDGTTSKHVSPPGPDSTTPFPGTDESPTTSKHLSPPGPDFTTPFPGTDESPATSKHVSAPSPDSSTPFPGTDESPSTSIDVSPPHSDITTPISGTDVSSTTSKPISLPVSDFTTPKPGTDESPTTSKHVSLPSSDSSTPFPGTDESPTTSIDVSPPHSDITTPISGTDVSSTTSKHVSLPGSDLTTPILGTDESPTTSKHVSLPSSDSSTPFPGTDESPTTSIDVSPPHSDITTPIPGTGVSSTTSKPISLPVSDFTTPKPGTDESPTTSKHVSLPSSDSSTPFPGTNESPTTSIDVSPPHSDITTPIPGTGVSSTASKPISLPVSDFTTPKPGTDESPTTSKHVSLPSSDSSTPFPGTDESPTTSIDVSPPHSETLPTDFTTPIPGTDVSATTSKHVPPTDSDITTPIPGTNVSPTTIKDVTPPGSDFTTPTPDTDVSPTTSKHVPPTDSDEELEFNASRDSFDAFIVKMDFGVQVGDEPIEHSALTSTTTKTTTVISTPRPPILGSCVVQGDPHYHTYDNQVHNFMGNCTYTLSKLCGDDGELPFFNVEAANENRGTNTRVSYIKYVNVDVYGYRITLDKGNQVKVDGEIVTLPTTLTPEVKIFLSGVNVMVTTSFGLQVKYDGKSKVVVTIPDDYADKLCGICGNFNGNKTDDFLNPDGELEPDSSSLGNSWQVENDTNCSPGTDHTPECTEDEKNTIASNSFCGLITDINGPFQACHAVVDPSDYFGTCVYDLCELNLDLGILCSSLQSYADACQSHGVTIEPWRNETFCPLECPVNSHYEPCGTACPATCVNPGSPSSCSLPCAEGCVCDPGYVLYDKKCVPSLQCGCWDEDKYYPVGSEFWTDDTCSKKCRCPSAGSSLVCNSESCPSNQYCKVTNGQASCQYYVYGICRIHNDPHYDTFDRQNHDFMGLCTYTLAKLCDNSSSLPYFNIEAKNEHRGDPSVTYVQQVLVEVYGYRVHILKNEPARVLVNHVWVTLPVILNGGAVKVSGSGRFVVLETSFKLKVSYDTDHSVEVKLPDTFSNKTCGMCGNFNNRKQDDYIMPNGQMAVNSNELGKSWIVYDGSDPQCSVQPTASPPSICSEDEGNLFESEIFCGQLTSAEGLFSICHSVVDPASFFESCVFDLCALGENNDILCGVLQAYADACQKEGVTIPNWRNITSCGAECPSNSHYNPCMTACPATCFDPQAPDRCPESCLEGCECDEGYIISGGTCVSATECGCWHNDKYYNKGETILENNCKSSCECLGNNIMVCSSVSCTADEICKVQNGLLGCYPASTAICHIYGDPHYRTFDGTLHHFQGSCNYTVTETCANTSDNFIVTTRNEHRGSPHWTAINSVALTVDGTHIVLKKNNIVLVNNASVTLPANVPGITIRQNGHHVIVTTNFGLELQFNGDHELFVRVKEYYKDTLCGLCGTYNDNKNDDLMTPDGNVVSDVNDFGNSWRVEDDEWICETTPPPPVTCPPLLQEEAEAQCTIIKLENGPFAPCHSFIPPEQYFESCVYDHCASDGNHDLFCDSLESYAASCEGIGVSVGDWRKDTICEVTTSPSIPSTPSHTTTEIPEVTTSSAIPSTPSHTTTEIPEVTTSPSIPSTPSHTTTEIPEVTTSPSIPSTPSHTTTEIPASTTTRTTTATTTTPITTPAILDQGICIASGDPHYNTFDGRVHHYMGNCSYTLSKLCDGSPSGLPDFHVYTTNEHRGSNSKVSYVQSVHVHVYDNTFDLLKNKKLNVNGTRRNVPITDDSRFIIYISGNYLILETAFGLRVKFDGNHYVEVYLPAIYQGHVCGLCGNYNGRSNDDLIKPDGSTAADSNDLGNSWIVPEEDKLCGSQDLEICDPSLENEYSRNTVCGIISDPTGIFRDCHALVNPSNFVENCVLDMCFTGGESTSLCYAVQAYAQKCSEAGVCLAWRSDTFCPISCPARSHYESCGTECPDTCFNSPSQSLCRSVSVEGCFCDDGFILSGDRCVEQRDCGCVDEQNNFYQLGESWFTREDCTERCTCNRNSISCTPWNCGDLQKCQNLDGVLGCQSSGEAACQVSGDPHYFTFDKVMHTFMGTCTYQLVTLCDTSNVIPVTISGKNEDRGQRRATYIKEIYINVYNIPITLQKANKILVDTKQIHTPWIDHENGISISTVGIYVVVETDFGMIVKFDGDHHLEIILPDAYHNKVCGMCGNFNGIKEDDLLMPNGLQATNVTQFGNSWKSDTDSDKNCLNDDREDLNPQCSDAQKPAIESQCNALFSDTYRACHHLVDPALFAASCVYDMCRYNGMVSTLCAIFQAYVDACRSEGVNIDWRSPTLCPLTCPTHSHYSTCVSLCPSTCNDIFAPAVCDKPNKCVEGCVCNDGYVLSNSKCVTLKSCGCRDEKDNYYSVDDTWLSPDCSQKCQCNVGNFITCKTHNCPHSTCSVNKAGKYNCKPSGHGKCTIAGDPHYRTFDGLAHHFQGKETYVLSRSSPQVPDYLEPFIVQGENVPMYRQSEFTLLKEIRIEVYGHVIIFAQKKKLVVDGVKTEPPFRPNEGIHIYQRPTRIYLETDFGLSVSFDGLENAEVIVPSTHREVLQGLCGNYDGRSNNDFMRPDGSIVNNVKVFGESWNVKTLRAGLRVRRNTDEEEEVLDTGDNLACSATQLAFVNSTSFCGVLRDTNGPFKNCLPYVPSDDFIVNCLFDTCAEFRSTELLCINLEQYAIACQENGTIIDGWRELMNCEMNCAANSVYKDRMTSCPASCNNLAAESECEAPLCEGCQCIEGYALSGFDCVPYKECGCTYLNKYYKVGEVFFTDECSQKCSCEEGSFINCENNECEVDQVCTTSDQIVGCYIPGPCLENPCQNGGTCIEEPSGAPSANNSFNCQCPKTYTGEFCENDQPSYNEVTIYIVIGVVVGVFVISIVFILAAYFYMKSRSKKRLVDSTDSSEEGRNSYTSISAYRRRADSLSEVSSGSVDLINFAYEEPPSVDNNDVNLNVRKSDDVGTENNVFEKSGAAINLAFEEDVDNFAKGKDVNTIFEASGAAKNLAFVPDTFSAIAVDGEKKPEEDLKVKTGEDTNRDQSADDTNLKESQLDIMINQSDDTTVGKTREDKALKKDEEDMKVDQPDGEVNVQKHEEDKDLKQSEKDTNVNQTNRGAAVKKPEEDNYLEKPKEDVDETKLEESSKEKNPHDDTKEKKSDKEENVCSDLDATQF
ncbi:IgGFc-binding protein-like [Pelodytes ibericus]